MKDFVALGKKDTVAASVQKLGRILPQSGVVSSASRLGLETEQQERRDSLRSVSEIFKMNIGKVEHDCQCRQGKCSIYLEISESSFVGSRDGRAWEHAPKYQWRVPNVKKFPQTGHPKWWDKGYPVTFAQLCCTNKLVNENRRCGLDSFKISTWTCFHQQFNIRIRPTAVLCSFLWNTCNCMYALTNNLLMRTKP